MYIRSRDNTNYIKKITINLGEELGQEKPEDVFLVLREMKTSAYLQMADVAEEGTKAIFDFFRQELPNLIVNHNIYETEAKLMSNEDIAELVFETKDATKKVVETYSNWLNFTQGKKPEDK